MGRQIRRVPADWRHPRDGEHYKPLRDSDFESAMQRWLNELQQWKDREFARVRGQYPDIAADPRYAPDCPLTAFVAWQGEAPSPEYYRRRWAPDEATHYQLYETVSEGTPLSPPFASKAELVEYLVEHGDGCDRPVSRAAAEAFVRDQWAPSLVYTPEHGIQTGIECLTAFKSSEK